MSDSVSGRKQQSCGSSKGASREKGASSYDMSAGSEESVRYKSDKDAPVYKGSDEKIVYSCDACRNVGDLVEAQGFCIDCTEYLCGTCFSGHSRSKLSKHHSLLDKDEMPRHCDPCHTVGDKAEAEGYCQNCKEYLCGSCYRSHSRSMLSREHVLVDNSRKLPSSITRLAIKKGGAGYLKCKEEFTYIRDINIKADKDEHDCFITDMAMVSKTELVLCDFENKSLKFVDIEHGIIKKTSRLNVNPRAMAVISKDKLAVVTANRTILIMSILEKSTVLQKWEKQGDCVNIEFINGKLYVSFANSSSQYVKFQIIQPTGAKIGTINTNLKVRKLCTLPRHIAVSSDESEIYVSDCKTNKVMSVGVDGSLKAIYQGELKIPRDIKISPFGSVYLCNTYKHVIYKLPPDLSRATLMLGPEDGLFYPQTMCFNTDKQHLYISSGITKSKVAHTSTRYANCIKVFKWK